MDNGETEIVAMKTRYFAMFGILLLPVVMICAGVHAQDQEEGSTVDLESITCRTLFKLDSQEKDNLVIFMHGFLSGKLDETLLDVPELTEVTDQIIDHCIDNPDETLLSAYERFRS